MALISCPACSKQVSAAAATCPNCGHPIAADAGREKLVIAPSAPILTQPKKSDSMGGAVAIGGVAILLIAWMISASKSSDASSDSSTVSRAEVHYYAGDRGTTKATAIVCLTRQSFDRLVELVKDKTASSRYLADLTNGCTEMPAGADVTVEENVGHGVIRMRRNGSVISVWTFESYLSR